MKNILLILLMGSNLTILAQSIDGQPEESEASSMRASRDFLRTYGDSMNEKWYLLPNGILAEYSEKAVHIRVVYNKRGNWEYTLKQYSEKEMSRNVRAKVKSVYYDYTIYWVKEVLQPEGRFYFVGIEDSTEWKTLLITEDDMNVIAVIRKDSELPVQKAGRELTTLFKSKL